MAKWHSSLKGQPGMWLPNAFGNAFGRKLSQSDEVQHYAMQMASQMGKYMQARKL